MTFKRLYETLILEVGLAKGFRLKTIAALFRIANYYYHGKIVLRYLLFPFVVFYKVLVEFIFGLELPASTNVDIGLRIFHGVGLVIHRDVVIGANCILRQGVTVGNKDINGAVPIVGNNVEFGANSVVIGDINIGDNSIIGAGAVITKDLPPNSIAVAQNFRLLNKKNEEI